MADRPLTEVSTLKQVALEYARRGFFVFPLWPITPDKKCACGAPPEKCRGAGKHPRFAKHQYTNARWSCTTDPKVIERMWSIEPKAGVGIACHESGLLVLDFGSDDALNWFSVQETRHGEIETLDVRTRKGLHIYLKAPSFEVKSTVGVLHKGVDTRAFGGYVVAPGSVHVSGHVYEVECDAPIAECPEWISTLLKSTGCAREKRPITAQSIEPPTPASMTEAKAICEHYVARLEGRAFPGSVYGLLNTAAHRLGQFAASGCLDPDYVRGRLVAGLRACDVRDLYLEKNLKIIDAAMSDAEDQPDVPHSMGSTLTRDDL